MDFEYNLSDVGFKRIIVKITGLLKVGMIKSKFVIMDSAGNKYIESYPNYFLSDMTEDNEIHTFQCFEKYEDDPPMIKLFNEDGELKKELFGTVKVKIIEMDKGYKSNTVFYGICEDINGNEIIVHYGLMDKKRKNIEIGEILEISPLEMMESDQHNKNEKLLEKYGKNIVEKNSI